MGQNYTAELPCDKKKPIMKKKTFHGSTGAKRVLRRETLIKKEPQYEVVWDSKKDTPEKKQPDFQAVRDRKLVKDTPEKKHPEFEEVWDCWLLKDIFEEEHMKFKALGDSRLVKDTPEKKEPEFEKFWDCRQVKDTPEKKEPEFEEFWDSRPVKAKEPETIRLFGDSDEEEATETWWFKFVSKGTQTEDLPSADEESTEHDQLETKSISKLTKHLEDLLLEGQDHDVTIKVQNHPFKAHKAVLQARSPVFLSMFSHDMEESASGVVTINDCDPSVFDQFLKHIYTGKFEMDSVKSAIALHYAADKYDFPELKEACVRYLYSSFSTTTVCDVIKMAVVHGEKQLLQKASMFFEQNLEEILPTVEWQIFLRNESTMANELLLQAVLSRRDRNRRK